MSHPFDQSTPDLILDAMESLDYLNDAQMLTFNNYENRVCQTGIENSEPLVIRSYRLGH